MRKYLVVPALVAAALGLSACSQTPEPRPGDTISEVVYYYRGAPLYCVAQDMQTNYATLSCDFVRWHEENPSKRS